MNSQIESDEVNAGACTPVCFLQTVHLLYKMTSCELFLSTPHKKISPLERPSSGSLQNREPCQPERPQVHHLTLYLTRVKCSCSLFAKQSRATGSTSKYPYKIQEKCFWPSQDTCANCQKYGPKAP